MKSYIVARRFAEEYAGNVTNLEGRFDKDFFFLALEFRVGIGGFTVRGGYLGKASGRPDIPVLCLDPRVGRYR